MLTLETIIKNCKAPARMERVDTPGWGDPKQADPHVYVRQMPASRASLVTSMCASDDGGTLSAEDMYVNFCILAVCDKDGNTLFDESHREFLLKGPLQPVIECGTLALSMNGVSKDKTEKNSESRDDSSRSGSPKS